MPLESFGPIFIIVIHCRHGCFMIFDSYLFPFVSVIFRNTLYISILQVFPRESHTQHCYRRHVVQAKKPAQASAWCGLKFVVSRSIFLRHSWQLALIKTQKVTVRQKQIVWCYFFYIETFSHNFIPTYHIISPHYPSMAPSITRKSPYITIIQRWNFRGFQTCWNSMNLIKWQQDVI